MIWLFSDFWQKPDGHFLDHFLSSELSGHIFFFQKSETPRGYLVHTERAAEAPTMRGATETSALLEAPSYARGPPERAGPSSAGKFRDVEEGAAPDVDGHDQHRRGRGLFARVVAGAALVVGCVALVGSGASRFHSTPMLGDASRHTERGDVAELSGNAPAGQQSKPRLLVAVISWQGGFEDTDAQERTWLPLLKDASPDIEVDYRVFIGRDFEKETDQETNAEAYRRRRMLRFDGEQTRRGPSVVTTGILPSNGDGGVGVDGVLGAGGGNRSRRVPAVLLRVRAHGQQGGADVPGRGAADNLNPKPQTLNPKP